MSETDCESIHKKYGINPKFLPQHIAIVMDGNGRWAKKKKLSRNSGHKAGRMVLKQTLKDCTILGIKYLSVYAFSTENWKRPKLEVNFLMNFFKNVLDEEINQLHQQNVRMRFLGDIQALSPGIITRIEKAEELTRKNDTIQLNLMMNYGSKNEILQGVKKLLIQKKNPESLTETDFSQVLYTAGIPDPEIFIRTSGEYRISNYLLWQIAYSEFFFLDVLWPDFTMKHLATVIHEFQKRERRFGGL